MTLRDYQERAVNAIEEEWKENDSTLLVCATGTGKTQIFSELIRRRQPQRAMILAHREELIWQAQKRLESLDIEAEVEMADFKAGTKFWNMRPVVVSTIQTQCAGKNGSTRMAKFNPEEFSLLIIDEAHHATAQSYRRVIDHYRQNPNLKVLGVTATPDRADEEALGKVFQTVAFDYEILDAIKDGWLVPIEQQMVEIESLDYSHIRTTAGDLNGADLAEVMEAEKNLQGIAAATIEIIGKRKTIVFTASVRQAESLSGIFNRHREGMSRWVYGGTPKEIRREILKDFAEGSTQVVANCGILSEGFDEPGVEVIVQARPTKSRCLYSQQIGRGTRPLPKIVDGIDAKEERRFAIETSAKPSLLVVDFVGNSGRHKLITSADVLGGNVSEEAIELAIKKIKKEKNPRKTDELLEEAQREIEERKKQDALRKARLVAKAKYTSKIIDPFNIFQLEPARERGWDAGKSLSEKQKNLLRKQGIDPDSMSYVQAKQLIVELFRRWKDDLCSLKQANILKRYGYSTQLTRKEASALIDQLAKNHWKRVG